MAKKTKATVKENLKVMSDPTKIFTEGYEHGLLTTAKFIQSVVESINTECRDPSQLDIVQVLSTLESQIMLASQQTPIVMQTIN
jgi:hypothetical protein